VQAGVGSLTRRDHECSADSRVESRESGTIGLGKLDEVAICSLFSGFDPGREMCDTVIIPISLKLRILLVVMRSNNVRACEMLNPYCDAWANTQTKPSSVMEQVASWRKAPRGKSSYPPGDLLVEFMRE
jgi:hypothetical protein